MRRGLTSTNSEDTVSAAIQPVLAVKALYEANSDAIHEATKVLATIGGGAGRAIEDWVGVVDKVVGGLNELAQSSGFPFVGGKINLLRFDICVNMIAV